MACKRSPVRSRLAPPIFRGRVLPPFIFYLSPSSRGLGHRPFTAVTGVRIPLGTPNKETGHIVPRFFVWLLYPSKRDEKPYGFDNQSPWALLFVSRIQEMRDATP